MKPNISYYVMFIDCNGHTHYAVHKYNRLSGIVTSMRDYVF